MDAAQTPTGRHDFDFEDWNDYGSARICKCGEGENAPVHDPAEKITHVVGGQGYWGSGTSLEEAKRIFRRMGGKLSKHYSIGEFPEDATFLGVNQMGACQWRGPGEPTWTEVNAPKTSAASR